MWDLPYMETLYKIVNNKLNHFTMLILFYFCEAELLKEKPYRFFNRWLALLSQLSRKPRRNRYTESLVRNQLTFYTLFVIYCTFMTSNSQRNEMQIHRQKIRYILILWYFYISETLHIRRRYIESLWFSLIIATLSLIYIFFLSNH